MSAAKSSGGGLSGIIGRLAILIVVGVSFGVGLLGAFYLNFRSPEVAVPEIIGKDQSAGRLMVEDVGLNLRVRASRLAPDARPNTILDQSPKPGDVIKVGQTIAVVIARAEAREGEAASRVDAMPNTNDTPENTEDTASDKSNEASSNRNDRTNRNSNRNSPRNRNANNNRNANTNRDSTNRNTNANRNANTNRNNNSANTNANNNRRSNTNRSASPAANSNANQTRNRTTTNANRP